MIAWVIYLGTLVVWIMVLRKARQRPDHKRTWFTWLLILGILAVLLPGLFMLPLLAVTALYWFRYARRPAVGEDEGLGQNPID
jgi:hypothetical protein